MILQTTLGRFTNAIFEAGIRCGRALERNTRRTTKQKGIHIAVIVSETIDDVAASELQFVPPRRGDWAAFMGIDQEAVIRQAKEALDRWKSDPGAPYIILVGTISGRAQFPTAFKVVPL